MARNFFITTAISYPNGLPHIGHAYEVVAADVIARFRRLAGDNVHFVTGTDDHGQKMFRTARDRDMSAEALADEMTPAFRKLGEEFDCSYDDFIRTSEARHHEAVAEIWRRVQANGDIYKDTYSGWYSIRDEAFYGESELTKNEAGERVSPQGTPVEWLEEESYFFRLSAYQERLLAHYEAHPEFIGPEGSRNEVVQFVKSGLKDLSISRSAFDWGVKVPDDPDHIVYVWMDALTNYLTALGFPDEGGDLWKNFWPAGLHVIGKDITRFHAVYWPAFLMAAGLEIPERIFAHGFLTVRGEKMSKSAGNALEPSALVARYGAEAMRHFFMRDVPFGRDGGFDDAAIINRVNADLANDLGNLAQRCLSMIAKNCGGTMPAPDALAPEDETLLAQFDGLLPQAEEAIEACLIHRYLAAVFEAVSEANRYFARNEPWVLKNSDPTRMGIVLYVAAEAVRQAAILVQPVVPKGAGALLDQLAVAPDARDFAHLGETGRLEAGAKLPPPQSVFPRLAAPEETA